MANYGLVAIMLMFAISFTLYVGGGDNPDGSPRFASNFLLFIAEIDQDGVNIMRAMINSFLSPEFLVAGVVTVIAAAVSTFTVTYTLPALALGVLAPYFLFPLSFIHESGLPLELGWLIYGFFILLMIGALLSYIRGTQL